MNTKYQRMKNEKQTNRSLPLSEDKEGEVAHSNSSYYSKNVYNIVKRHLFFPSPQVYQNHQDKGSYSSNAKCKSNIFRWNHFPFNKDNAIRKAPYAKTTPSIGCTTAPTILAGRTNTVEITPAANQAAAIVIKNSDMAFLWSRVYPFTKTIVALNEEKLSRTLAYPFDVR